MENSFLFNCLNKLFKKAIKKANKQATVSLIKRKDRKSFSTLKINKIKNNSVHLLCIDIYNSIIDLSVFHKATNTLEEIEKTILNILFFELVF